MAKNVGLMLVAGVLICLVLATPATAAVSIPGLRPKRPKGWDFCSPARRTSVFCRPGPSPAITCAATVVSCSSFIRAGGRGSPPATCCNGIRTLNSADTSSDRQAACRCLKGLGSSLPSRCGVSVPYAISAKTDCSRIR